MVSTQIVELDHTQKLREHHLPVCTAKIVSRVGQATDDISRSHFKSVFRLACGTVKNARIEELDEAQQFRQINLAVAVGIARMLLWFSLGHTLSFTF